MLKKMTILLPLAVLVAAAVGFVIHNGTGSLSAFGWQSISMLCPLGALTTMLASKTLIPRAIVSLVIACVVILLVGRAFCSYVCPIPLVSRLRTAFRKNPHAKENALTDAQDGENPSAAEPSSLSPGRHGRGSRNSACSTCRAQCASEAGSKPAAVDSRHFVLVGALLSAAVFGFPVFCLICPIGLTFGLVMLVILLFGAGDVTWTVVFVPLVLLVEVVFFRKWCSRLCPLSALMSLVAKGNRTFRPVIDKDKCLEATKGATCGKCTQSCEREINLRRPLDGASISECTRCRSCVETCPAHAISMPLLKRVDHSGEERIDGECERVQEP